MSESTNVITLDIDVSKLVTKEY